MHGPNARKHCPKTCDSCPTAAPIAAPSTAAPSAAVACVNDDEGAKSLGMPNCAAVAAFCQDPMHGPNARKHCPKTCDSCPTAAPIAASSTAAPNATVACVDDDEGARSLGVLNCAAAAGFCKDPTYG